MIQFNLLPDVKADYIKARRLKQLVITISVLVSVAALAVLLLMVLTVDVVQKKSLSDASSDITRYNRQLSNTPNLSKMLTIQNQLNTLTQLHDQKAVSSRLFGYIAQLTPNLITISTLNIDFQAHTLVITGEAPSLDTVNTYTDTLKATTYKTDAQGATSAKAFSAVVLSNFGRDSRSATYTITLNFDPAIFNNASNVTLTVPTLTAGTAQTLFQKQAGN